MHKQAARRHTCARPMLLPWTVSRYPEARLSMFSVAGEMTATLGGRYEYSRLEDSLLEMTREPPAGTQTNR